MSKSLAKQARDEIDDALERALKDLKRAARDLGEDADTAITEAAERLLKATDTLKSKTAPKLENLVSWTAPKVHDALTRAESELRRRPIVTAVSALAAAAALLHVLGVARRASR